MITFDSYSLDSATIIPSRMDNYNLADRRLVTENLATDDGFEILRGYLREKIITIVGYVSETTENTLVAKLDDMKSNMQGINKNLDITEGANTRRYKATLMRLEPKRESHTVNHVNYQATFMCQPISQATSQTSVTENDITTASNEVEMVSTSTYKSKPIITIHFDSVSSVSEVEVTNEETGDVITITETFSASDDLIINCEEQNVTLNGTQVDFGGPMPETIKGANTWTIDVTSTSHQYDVTIAHTPKFI